MLVGMRKAMPQILDAPQVSRMPSTLDAHRSSLRKLGCNLAGIEFADAKSGYKETVLSEADASTYEFCIISTKSLLDRVRERGFDPELRREANYKVCTRMVPGYVFGTREVRRPEPFVFGSGAAGPKFKFIFAMPKKQGDDAYVSKALRLLGWMPTTPRATTNAHVFRAPAGTRYASAAGRVSASSEIMFPDLIPNDWFVKTLRYEVGAAGDYIRSDITSLFGG
jgi:hypothetical protein